MVTIKCELQIGGIILYNGVTMLTEGYVRYAVLKDYLA